MDDLVDFETIDADVDLFDPAVVIQVARQLPGSFGNRVVDFEKLEAKKEAVASAEAAGKKNDLAKLPHETVDEYFRRKSHIRQMIYVIRERKQKELGKLIPGTQQYADAVKRFKDWAVPYCTEEFNNPANQARFPDAVRQGLVWFKNLKAQFIEVTQSHMNIDAFGNQIALAHDTWEALFNFRRYAHNVPLVMLAAQSGMKWDEGMRPSVVLLGAKSCGKSYLLESISKQFHDGVFDDVTHRTAMTATTGDDNDLKNMSLDEAPASVLGGGCGASAKEFAGSAAASVAKSTATRKRVHTQTLSMEDGTRKRMDYYSSNIGTAILASNVKAPTSSNPQMARLIPLTIDNVDATNEDAIEKLLLKLQETELDPLKKDLLEQRKLINFYIMMTELYIAFGVIQQVQMDAWVMYFQRYCNNMELFNFVLTDPKKVVQITELARTATVNYAVQIGLFSEITFKQRMVDYRDPNSDYVRFFDHARFFVDLIERHLVCTRAITVYTVSLCREMWANQLRMTALSSAYKMTVGKHLSIFDESCTNLELTQSNNSHTKVGTGTGSSSSSSSSSSSISESSNLPFEEDPDAIDDYGEKFDNDSSNVRPDEEGNYLGSSLKVLAVSSGNREINAEEAKRLLQEEQAENDMKTRKNTLAGPSPSADDDEPLTYRPLVEDSNSQRSHTAPAPTAQPAAPAVQLTAAQIAEAAELAREHARKEANEALNMFLCEYQNGDVNSGIPDVNYVELRGVHMTIAGACQALAQQVSNGSKPSLDNLETTLHEMEQQDITVPVYKLQGRKVVRTTETNTIKMVRIEQNTARFDPKMAHGGGATRVYVALHSVLNNHSLDKAIIKSIRNLGFNNSLPGRFVINMPVEARRYPDNPNDLRIVQMYGINRVVKIVPRNSRFIYVKASTITPDMLDILSNTRRGSAKIELTPSLLNCSHALSIVVEPEISAAMHHSKMCGMPPGTPLHGTPVLLEKWIKQCAQEIPHLRTQKLYAYPGRKMDEARCRYFIQDGHTNELINKSLQGSLPTNVDMTRVARTGKLPNPDTEIMRAVAATSMESLVDMIVPSSMRASAQTTFTDIIKMFDDEALFREQMTEIGVEEKIFMDAFHGMPLDTGSRRAKTVRYEHGNGVKGWRNIRSENEKKKQTAKVTAVGALPRSVSEFQRPFYSDEMSIDEFTGPVTMSLPTELVGYKKSLSLLMSTASQHPLESRAPTTIVECLTSSEKPAPETAPEKTTLDDARKDMRFFQQVMGFDEADRIAARPPLAQNIRPKANSSTPKSSSLRPSSPTKPERTLRSNSNSSPPKTPERQQPPPPPQPQQKRVVQASNKSQFTKIDYVQIDPNK